MLAADNDKFVAEEDAQARYRFTPSRYEKAAPPNGEWDAVFIGSGPGSLACASVMSKIGWRCAVFEQGEQLGGGAHVFPEHGFEFETGVHYLGDEPEMRGLLDFLTCGRLKLGTMGTKIDGPMAIDGQPVAGAAAPEHTRGWLYDNVVVEGRSYNFVAGRHKLIAMLRERFPSSEDKAGIDAFESLFDHHTSTAYKTSAAKFFVLKVPWLLNLRPLRPLRTLLQTAIMGKHYYRSTQLTAEEMLVKCGIKVGAEPGLKSVQHALSSFTPPPLCLVKRRRARSLVQWCSASTATAACGPTS